MAFGAVARKRRDNGDFSQWPQRAVQSGKSRGVVTIVVGDQESHIFCRSGSEKSWEKLAARE
jgi:hypothetical protein